MRDNQHSRSSSPRPPIGARAAAGLLLLSLLTACGQQGAPPLLTGARPEVDAVFVDYDTPGSPGCSLGVIENGEFIYRKGYGLANLEYNIPLDADSVFRVGSVSKQFVAMLVLLLERDGELSLDDDVHQWIPELPDFGEEITVAHLLYHTSGLRDYLELMALAGYRDEDYYNADELLAVLSRQRELNFTPGDEHLYSNTGYFLLGQIIERITGKSLNDAAQERIFGPLGMTSTHFQDDASRIVPHRASGYAPAEGGGFVISMTTLPIVGDGGVFTTVNDLLAWDRNFYDNQLGGGQALIDRWLTPGRLNDGSSAGYSAGIVDYTYRGLRVVGHGGAFVGFRAEVMRFPEQRLGVITLCNVSTANPTRLSLRVAEVFLGDQMSPPEATVGDDESSAENDEQSEEFPLPVAELRDFEGRFVSPELQVTYVLSVGDGQLVWEIPHKQTSPLRPQGEDRFRAESWPVVFRFVRTSRGQVSGFLVDLGRVKNLWFERVD